jgi:ResB-like family
MLAIYSIFDTIYRFLASLKLAVISLGTLAAVLAYATFFESWYGTAAVQEWIYKSKGFAILLAFLGANILCAALIRFPWKRRQIGFLITHSGLLILLAGSFLSVKRADEGQVGLLEGEVRDQLVRIEYPAMRVRRLDPETREPRRESAMPFRPGTFAWGPGDPKPRGSLGSIFQAVTFGLFDGSNGEVDVLSQPGDPFQFVVKAFLPASIPAVAHVTDPSGSPMAKIRPRFKGPSMPRARDVFEPEERRWFNAERPAYRAVKDQGPAQFVFLYVDRPELVEDFLNPPNEAGKAGVARFRYRDKTGRTRSQDWPLGGQEGKTLALPESDLTVTFGEVLRFPAGEAGLGRVLGEASIPIAEFKVRKGEGPEVPHYGWAALPMFPNVIPTRHEASGNHQGALVSIDFILPPVLDPASNGRFGVVEVLGTPDGALYYRVFGRGEGGVGQVRASGRLRRGEEIVAFGGKPDQPMTISFEVEDYLTTGREKEICEPLALPKGQMGSGIPAALVEMTVDGHTEEFWVRRSSSLEPLFQRVSFPGGDYEVALDFDRQPLGFQLKLVDFQVGFDPGTDQASSYVSKVLLNDEAQGIKDRPFTIQMNEPLTHRGYTFYQSSYARHRDPRTGREDGQFLSIFQVATDPGRPIKYIGCLGVVLGAFVQFYMRAGVFTDGGLRERERAFAAARRRARANGHTGATEAAVAVVSESEEIL